MPLANKLRHFRIDKPHRFRLSDYDSADTCGLDLNKPVPDVSDLLPKDAGAGR